MVFQRDLANQAVVTVAGMAPATATFVEARFVPLAINQGSVTAWTALTIIPGSSAFKGNVTVSAGWYRLDVRAKAGSTILAQTSVGRIGVGEVFVVAGQSNVFGGFERAQNALDDRVSCVDFRQDSLSEQLLPLQFSRIDYGAAIGPSQPPHLWGALGDKLVQRLNVPVLFLGAALGGTSSTQWQQSAAGNIGTTVGASVYRRLGAALLHYIARTGARAILWHQGESDLSTSQSTYYNNINYVITKSRQQLGSGSLPWMVCRVSWINYQTNSSVIQAQNQLIATVPNVFAGPATDTIIGPVNRPDNVHLIGPGRVRFTNAWDQSLSAAFFQNAAPFMPADPGALITSGYTLPLTRKQGETIAVASLRSDPHEANNQYVAQIVRASDGVTVHESSPSNDNPILLTIPASLPNGQYRLRTRSTNPVIVGTLGEPFTVQSSATPSPPFVIHRPPVRGGSADPAIKRFTYNYEAGTYGFFALVEATAAVEVRLQRLDGGNFTDSNWNPVPPSSQAPDRDSFANFNYIRNYPPVAAGVGGVEPGRYRYSVRRQGDTGEGLWFDLTFIDARSILYQSESIPPVPPILTINNLTPTSNCLSGIVNVDIEVSDGPVNGGNVFSVRLSDANGSFANETTIGSGTTSPVSVTLSPSLPAGTNYRLRVVGSNPTVASAPSQPLTICGSGADLSMDISVSNRTPATNQPVTLTVVLTNAGPQTVDGVVAKSLLPPGMEFVDTPSAAVSTTANTVTINGGTIPGGVSMPFIFRLKASQSGSFIPSAQITASSQPDPDSQPNSGTGDGQDDTAAIDFRTPNASGPPILSPNPNQTPLPPVSPSQPPTDPTKADLQLGMRASTLVASPNQVVPITLTVFNRGGATANNVNLQALLPVGWQLTVTAGLTVRGQSVSANVGSVPAGSSLSLVLLVRVRAGGTLRAQVLSVNPADTDSTPGNGNANGEDDEATLSLRMR